MVISNTNDKEVALKTDFCAEILRGAKSGRNVITDKTILDLSVLKIPAQIAWVIEVK